MEHAIKKGKYTIACEILEECQQGVIELGNMIEMSEGAGNATVTILELYCEAVYGTYSLLSAGNVTDAFRELKKMRSMLVKSENSVSHDIRVRREIVFLPYKAAMWDSLESVWRAADADEDTDAYVIPVPYYDKNPDGSFREEHYEGDRYPEYVPVTCYDSYDFESRRPDMIFIHNPYDDQNYVTSVHPFFYSQNLKKYTDRLIYIPYFVLPEILPNDKGAVDEIKHFFMVRGVFNADKTIVQSENMRQIYIDTLVNETGSGDKDGIRRYWNKKIDGSGSPKFDKVRNTNKDNLEIPPAWSRIIEKPDGGRKKIIFYNTSITALLLYDDQMLEKMEDVFRFFYDNKSEMALLWRPHPLIMSTLSSMRPQLWNRYLRIMMRYLDMGWGIYDDTTDIDRAIVLSDAYYGDPSSVVQMYQTTGKPVMIQNVYISM